METLIRSLAWIVGAGLALTLGALPAGAAPALSENQLKAVFLFQFSQFVDWPARAFAQPGDPFVIGLLGGDPFGAILDDLVRSETATGRAIVVRRLGAPAEARSCQIVFVATGAEKALAEAALGKQPVLTVGESPEFDREGGMILFVRERSRVRLRINLGPALQAGLTISSKLLRVADQVEGLPP